LELDAVLDVLGEAGLFDGQLVPAGRQERQAELAGFAASSGVGEASVDVFGDQFGAGDDCFRLVGDKAEDFGAGLGEK